jgi:hypothetical protein
VVSLSVDFFPPPHPIYVFHLRLSQTKPGAGYYSNSNHCLSSYNIFCMCSSLGLVKRYSVHDIPGTHCIWQCLGCWLEIHAQESVPLLWRYYALAFVGTSRYLLRQKRNISTKTQVEVQGSNHGCCTWGTEVVACELKELM